MDATTVRLISNGREADLPYALSISLKVTDPQVIQELMVHPEGAPREEYTLTALRIGVLALMQARGQIDGEKIQREGEKLLASLQGRLELHSSELNGQLTNVLKEYFDPDNGRFHERVERLVKKDGELEGLLRRQIGTQDSELCKTLTAHVGESSPLFKILSPKESEGLLKSLSDALVDQRTKVLEQFTLDKPESALSRLVRTITANNTELSTTICGEFSLANENSALSLMCKQLKSTSQAIDNNLTLDKDTSALFRLKRELFDVLKNYSDASQGALEEIKLAINAMQVRRQAARVSPEHGKKFEISMFEFIQRVCQQAGEVVEPTGHTTGFKKNCKVGDATIEMGPDHVAAGCKIVMEAKDRLNFTLEDARSEIEEARQNRGAQVGLFVFAKANAPTGLAPIQRLGDDVFCVWDAEDILSDVYLEAALMVAHALCARQAKQRESQTYDLTEIEKSILDIEKQTQSLDEIESAASSINTQTEKITKRVTLAKRRIKDQVESLREQVHDLKVSLVGVDKSPAE